MFIFFREFFIWFYMKDKVILNNGNGKDYVSGGKIDLLGFEFFLFGNYLNSI